MARVRMTTNGISFKCPGCDDMHVVPTKGDHAWTWNGSVDLPTIQPSLIVRRGHFTPNHKPDDECWCGKDYGYTCYQCHSTIADGVITFCPDSSHALSGQSVPLAEITSE